MMSRQWLPGTIRQPVHNMDVLAAGGTWHMEEGGAISPAALTVVTMLETEEALIMAAPTWHLDFLERWMFSLTWKNRSLGHVLVLTPPCLCCPYFCHSIWRISPFLPWSTLCPAHCRDWISLVCGSIWQLKGIGKWYLPVTFCKVRSTLSNLPFLTHFFTHGHGSWCHLTHWSLFCPQPRHLLSLQPGVPLSVPPSWKFPLLSLPNLQTLLLPLVFLADHLHSPLWIVLFYVHSLHHWFSNYFILFFFCSGNFFNKWNLCIPKPHIKSRKSQLLWLKQRWWFWELVVICSLVSSPGGTS